MTRRLRTMLATLTALSVCSISLATAARADDGRQEHRARVLFAQTNDPAGNAVAVYDRAPDGTLALVETVSTGGLGARLAGAVTDPLASQGSLVYDSRHGLLFAVNAGSNTVSVLSVRSNHVHLRQVLPSGGAFPVSIAQHGNLVYVVNAAAAASIHGFAVHEGRLVPIRRSTRSLGLSPVTGPAQFVNTPGQIAFSPSGRQLLVTTKANGSTIDVFAVHRDGRPSHRFVANPSSTPVPFSMAFDGRHRLVVAEAGTSSLSTYRLRADGTVSVLASVTDGQQALCWIALDHGLAFGANTGSGTVTSYRRDASGHYVVVTETPVDSGPIDLAVSADGQFLYVEAGGSGTIDELRIGHDGTLTRIGTVHGLAGLEGIVAV